MPSTTTTGKTLYGLGGRWLKPTRYLEDGRLEINNRPENAIRPFVV